MRLIIFDGITLLYIATSFVLLVFIVIIFTQRQILRVRNNAARSRPQLSFASRIFSKSARALREGQLDIVARLCNEYHPRLTDCSAINIHRDTPYMQRMIAVDEINMDIDVQLRRIGKAARNSGESTLSYLLRIKKEATSLQRSLIYRIAYLEEAARFHPQKFDVERVMELRSLLNKFLKILVSEFGAADTLTNFRNLTASPFNEAADQYNCSSRKRGNKFGGSDGGRLLAREKEEQSKMLFASTSGSPVRVRRQSDSRSSLLT